MEHTDTDLKEQVKYLQTLPQPAQRTPEWFDARCKRITASEISACLDNTESVSGDYVKLFNLQNYKFNNKCCSHFDSRDDFIVKKCKTYFGENVFKDNTFTLWGKKYEPIATRFYRQHYKTEVIDFGLICHDTIPFLGASPDGITPDGIMLEIKCPYSRKINGVIPMHYWQQMMIQLECCNLEECDYLECEIKEMSYDEYIDLPVVTDDGDILHSGIIVVKNDENNTELKYIYPPDSLVSKHDYIRWSNEYPTDEYSFIYYCISKWDIIRVKRNREWFSKIISSVQNIHEQIQNLQNDTTLYNNFYNAYKENKNKKFNQMWNKTECILSDITK